MIPPAPKVHARDLPGWRVVTMMTQNTLAAWPDYAFDVPIYRRRIFGIDGVLVNDPAGVRHVMADAARKYARPASFARILRPLAGNGVLSGRRD